MELPKVTVATITYNQAEYILDTIRGVFNQVYDGQIEFIISNDCSTDNSDKVILDFINLNKPPKNIELKYFNQETNKGIINNFFSTLQMATGQYVAICEGDDYWSDPLKLQKQVKFLEENKDFTMIFTNANVLIESDQSASNKDRGLHIIDESREYKRNELLDNWTVPTASVLYRNGVISDREYLDLVKNEKLIFGDIVLFLYLASRGRVFGLSDYTVNYRRHIVGATNFSKMKAYDEKHYYHLKELIRIFGKEIKSKKIKGHLARLSLSISLTSFSKINLIKALTYLFKSINYDKTPLINYIKIKLNFD